MSLPDSSLFVVITNDPDHLRLMLDAAETCSRAGGLIKEDGDPYEIIVHEVVEAVNEDGFTIYLKKD